jgi:DNA-binding SARP family transcriptional activator
MNAIAVQPMWLKSEHYNWRELYTLEAEGNLQLAFDSENEDIIIAGPDKILKFSVRNNSETRFIPKNLNSNLLPQRQAVFDAQSDLLYCLDIDKPSVSVFDFNTLTWSKDLEPNIKDADFSHYNKYFSASDSSIYFFGGYGHHKYKNLVQRYDLVSQKMAVLKPSGDFYNPRYLAASGYLNDTVYILGGFGSATGEQILNPHSFNDMMTYSLKSNSFTRRFEIPFPNEDFAFSNSMVINPDDRSFYVLGFPIFSYNGYLQLIKGSIDKPGISILGSQIPYQFLDIVSYSDLFFCRQSKKLLAVTLQNEEGKSRVKIYSLGFPPDTSGSGDVSNATYMSFVKYAAIIMFVVFVIIGTHLYITRKKKRGGSEKTQDASSPHSILKDSSSKGESCSIHFFGDFQIINSGGIDITRKFTPLLKELFLLIWFNSIKNDMGISNEKITEILWHGFSESSANNNKAVNIAKLRAILTKDLWCDLSYKETGYWKIEYKNKNIINDYYDFIKITSGRTEISKPDMLRLIEFGQRGSLLSNLKYKWLDEFKVAVSNEMIDRLVRYERILVLKDQPEHIIKVADAIFNFDSVNEEAMENKCKASIVLGRHTVAKEVYDHFCREYKLLYNTDYSKSFTTIVSL